MEERAATTALAERPARMPTVKTERPKVQELLSGLAPAPARAEGACGTAIEFDFAAKRSRTIPLAEAAGACARGLSCWIDLDSKDEGVRRVLESIGVNPVAIANVLERPLEEGRHDMYADCVHATVAAIDVKGGAVQASHVQVLVARRFVVTVHRGDVEFIHEIRRMYAQDFERYAQTLSFVIFEVFDRLIDSYRRSLRVLSHEVQHLQARIFAEPNDQIFSVVGSETRSLLAFRASMLAARGVLHQLATRKSPFVSDTAQPFLENMVDTLERLGSDLSVERDILSETLDLYMGITSHRTNRVMNRLTALSAIFLPLTFLCGVYGMNFKHMPELAWRFGYLGFWAVVLIVVSGLVLLMRRSHWI